MLIFGNNNTSLLLQSDLLRNKFERIILILNKFEYHVFCEFHFS